MGVPEIDVVMAAAAGGSHLREAVESILAQDGVALSLLVVDDGTADGTADLLASFRDSRLRVIRNTAQLGLTASLNLAMAETSAPLVARMDADDIALPERLARQKRTLEECRADIVFCRCRFWDEAQGRTWPWVELPQPLRGWRNLFSNYYGPHPAALFRRDAVMGLGGYDETFRRGQDYDLWDRAHANGLTFAYDPHEGLTYRCHDASISRTSADEQFEAGRIVSARALRRQWPGLEDSEVWGLQWLMLEQAKPGTAEQIVLALGRLEQRVRSYIEPLGPEGRVIWSSVAAELSRRMATAPGTLRGGLASGAFRAAVRARSARALVRLISWRVRSRLRPGRGALAT